MPERPYAHCFEIRPTSGYLAGHADGIEDTATAKALEDRHAGWAADMPRDAAEQLLAGTGWLPPVLRTARPEWLADEQPTPALAEGMPEAISADATKDEPFPVAAE